MGPDLTQATSGMLPCKIDRHITGFVPLPTLRNHLARAGLPRALHRRQDGRQGHLSFALVRIPPSCVPLMVLTSYHHHTDSVN